MLSTSRISESEDLESNISKNSSTLYLIDSLDKLKNTQTTNESHKFGFFYQILLLTICTFTFIYIITNPVGVPNVGFLKDSVNFRVTSSHSSTNSRINVNNSKKLQQQQFSTVKPKDNLSKQNDSLNLDLQESDLQFKKKIKMLQFDSEDKILEHNFAPITTTSPDKNLKILTTSTSATVDPNHTQIFILSRRENFKARMTISKTWAKNYQNNITFIVGDYCPTPTKFRQPWECTQVNLSRLPAKDAATIEIQVEDYKMKQDALNEKIKTNSTNITNSKSSTNSKNIPIAMLDFIDTYRNLTLKVKKSYQYLLKKYPTANWFAKVDDDQYCRAEKLFAYLQNIVPLSSTDKYPVNDPINEYIVLGKIRDNAPVMRYGKWNELKKNYIKNTYPKFPVGSAGHVVNRKVAQFFVDNVDTLINYQGEDVSIGIWLTKADFYNQVIFKNLPFFDNMGVKSGCHIEKERFVVGHNIGPEKMVSCWENFNTGNTFLE